MKRPYFSPRVCSITLTLLASLLFYVAGWGQVAASNDDSAISGNETKLQVQIGHSMFVGSAEISADGKYIVTGSWDGTARLWEVETGNEIRQFFGNPGFVYSVAISADARRVAAGSPEGVAVLWDTATGKELHRLEGHTATVSAIQLSSDGKHVITGSWDNTARLWDAATGMEVRQFVGHTSKVHSVTISADGKYVATGTDNGTAYLWDAETGKEVRRFAGHSDWVRSIVISADGKYVATGGEDNTARVWDAATGKEVCKYKGHSNAVNAISFLTDGKHVVSGSFDRTAHVWDAATGKEVRKFKFNSDKVFFVSISPDAKYMVVSSVFSTVQLFETETGREAQRFEGHSASVGAVALSADGRYMLIGSWDNTGRLWETGTGKEAVRFVGHSRPIISAVISGDSKYVVTGGLDHTARLWEVATGRELHKFVGHSDNVESVAISRGGGYVLTGSADNTARLWDAATGKEVRRFMGHSRGVGAVAISPDDKFVLTGGNDATARLWDAATGKEVRRFVGQSGPKQVTVISSPRTERVTVDSEPTDATSVVFTADGKYVLAGGDDGVVRLWEAATGKEIRKFDGHAGDVTSLALSPDDKYLVTSSNDNTARLWEVETGRKLQRFVGHVDWIHSVALSADSRYVLTGGRDSTSRVWESATGRELCSLIFFSDDNWAVVTPAGLFDGSDLEEIRGLHWLMNDDPMRTYPLEIFMRDYYEPGLLARLLKGETFEGTRNISELNRAQPTVKIVRGEMQGESGMVTITVEVAGARSERQRGKDGRPVETGVYDLRLFRDGQLVGQLSDGEPQTLSPSANRGERLLAWRKESGVRLDPDGRRVVKFENIRLPRNPDSRRVVFSAYAFNEDRVKSKTARQGFILPSDIKPVKGRAYVVMFGVNAYEAECLSLDYAVNDVRKMQETFVNKLKQSGQYEEVIEVPLIADYRATPNGGRTVFETSATKDNLKTVFDLLSGRQVDEKRLAGIPNVARLRPARPEDMVTVFFSSHGDSDEQGNFYIVPYNIGMTKLCRGVPISDEDYNQVLARSISSEELSLWLRYVDAGEMVMIVDACHSAAAVKSGEFKPGPMGSRGLGQLAYDKRMKILAATQSDSVAREFRELNQSLLSYMLTKEGIEDGRADFKPADQVVTMSEWLQYGEARVPEWYADKLKEAARRDQSGATGAAPQGDKHLAHGRRAKQIQVPSLFDFTRKRRDSVLFRKVAALGR